VTPGAVDRLDVVTFEWTPRLARGGSGLGVVRSSLPEHEQARWSDELVTRVSVPPGDSEPSTCYLRFGDRAVLLHRTPVQDQLNRGSTRTTALIGPRSVLTLDRAIALRPDTEPDECDGPYESYPGEWAGASDDDDLLASLAKGHRDKAITLVAGLLNGVPAEGYAIRAGNADPRVLLWVASRCVPAEAWTFSTRESSTTAAGLPMLVFATGQQPRSSFGSQRPWLDLSRPLPGRPDTVAAATRRVDDVLAGRSRTAPLPQTQTPPQIQPQPRLQTRLQPPPQRQRRPAPERAAVAPRPRTWLPGPYALRLLLLFAWSAVFIVLLALAGQVRP
jgi:hypothetical protein